MSGVSRRQMKADVLALVPKEQFAELLSLLVRKEPHLWGEDRPDHFFETCLMITLYHWKTGKGYCYLAKAVEGWLKTSHNSLAHNSRVLARLLGKWGKAKIVLGTFADRVAAASRIQFKGRVEGVTLWMDSVDFRTIGLKTVSRPLFSIFFFF